MNTLRSCLFSAVLAAAALTLRAADPAEAPRVLLPQAVDEVLALVNAPDPAAGDQTLARRTRPLFEKYFAGELMTRRAVGPGWKDFTPEQQHRAVALFTELVIRTYTNQFTPGMRPKIAYGVPAELAPNRQEVPTTITRDQSTFAVTYRFEHIGSGWRIYDVVIEGVSLVANYRTQFASLFLKGGPGEILRVLETRLAEPVAPSSHENAH